MCQLQGQRPRHTHKRRSWSRSWEARRMSPSEVRLVCMPCIVARTWIWQAPPKKVRPDHLWKRRLNEPSLAGVARVARNVVRWDGESHMISFTSSRVALAGAWPPDMFLSREALEEASPSRQHGIDGRLEASYRWSYCEFLKDSGIELKMCGFLLLVITRHLRTRNQAHDTFNTSHLAGLN